MAIKVYHNNRCKKSRAGLEYLQSKTTDFEIIDYIKLGVTKKDLEEMVLKMNISPSELVRTQEEYFKKELKGKSFTDHEWIQIISENPKLLKRPVIISKHRAVIGDPRENIDKLF